MNEDLLEIHNSCIEKNLTFATFRLPRGDASTTYIQTTPQISKWRSIHDLEVKEGFMMAPFDTRNGKHYIVVKPDIVFKGNEITDDIIDTVKSLAANPAPDFNYEEPVITGREEYLQQIHKIKGSISTGAFQKAVLSRIRIIEGNFMPVITRIFQAICRHHPNAFVSLFKSEEHFWIGASPEPLINVSEGMLSTVSLAGTRSHSEENMEIDNWNAKEVLEQEYVTRYIHDILREFNIRDYRVNSPYVKKAGSLVHLRTDFSLKYDQVADRIWEFVDAMHPTPAVAGQPKDDAITFIKQLEPHDREYYTGFLGPVVSDENIHLFANLRCMKITPGYLALYVGGGITLESVPEDEWDETRLKAESLLSIIQNFAANMDANNVLQSSYRLSS